MGDAMRVGGALLLLALFLQSCGCDKKRVPVPPRPRPVRVWKPVERPLDLRTMGRLSDSYVTENPSNYDRHEHTLLVSKQLSGLL